MLPSRFRLVKTLGQGGMGQVLLVHDHELGRLSAMKVLQPGLVQDSRALQRFAREALAQSRITHPHLVGIYDLQIGGESSYLLMEYIEGTDLSSRLANQGPMTVPEVVRLGIEIGGALAALHQVGVLHRDLKPGNIMVRSQDSAFVLMDLGLASVEERTCLTQTGSLVGTPLYLPPEVLLSEPCSPTGDQYQLGCVLFQALTGLAPIEDGPLDEVLARITAGRRRVLASFPDLPPWLVQVVERSLHRRPDRRFPDIQELVEALRRGGLGAPPEGSHRSPRAPTRPAGADLPSRPLQLAAVFVVLTLGAFWGWESGSPGAPSPVPSLVPGQASGESPLASPGGSSDLLPKLDAAEQELRRCRSRSRVVSQAEGGARPFLETDPDELFREFREMPALQDLVARLAALPPDTELTGDEAKALQDLDRAYREEISLPPLGPFLPARLPPPGPPPPTLQELARRTSSNLRLPASVGRWLAEAGRAAAAARALVLRFEEEFRQSPELGAEGYHLFLMVTPNLGEAVREMSEAAGLRERYLAYALEGVQETRRMVYAAARSLREEPETEALTTDLVGQALDELRLFLVFDLPPAFWMGTPPETLGEEIFLVKLLHHWEDVRRLIPNGPHREHAERLAHHLNRLLPRLGTQPSARRDLVLRCRVQAYRRHQDGAGSLNFLRSYLPESNFQSPLVAIDCLWDVLTWMASRPSPPALTRSELTTLLDRAEPFLAVENGHSSELAEVIRKLRHQLAASPDP